MSVASATWAALGSTALVAVTDAAALSAARRAVERELTAIDRACSRFRDDSELSTVHRADGAPVAVSALLAEAVDVALAAARQTDGLVDPTVGAAIVAAGYDRDFAELRVDDRPVGHSSVAGHRSVRLDRIRGRLQLAPGLRLDLGATAKALAADRAAAAAASAITPHGVLVSLGGDIAVSGPGPEGGWPVGIADGHRDIPDVVVSVKRGGLATSSTTQRRWMRAGREAHHIVDPRTGTPAREVWRTVSVAAFTCVEANVASTAAIVLGHAAPAWLARHELPARLVAGDGTVTGTCGWAPETAAA